MRLLLRQPDGKRLAWACVGVVLGLACWEAVSIACRWITAAREQQAELHRNASHMAFETWLITQEMGKEYLDARDFARALDVDR